MLDAYGTPYTPALHLVERYRLTDGKTAKAIAERNERENSRTHTAIVNRGYTGKGLQMQLRVEDTGAFTMPFSASVTYRKAAAGEWPETVCAENTRDFTAPNGETKVPEARTPDF